VIACFLGGIIGAAAGWGIDGPLFFIFPPIGGLVGYLVYNFKAVLSAIGGACREVFGWRPNVVYWRTLAFVWWVFFSTSICVLSTLFMGSALAFCLFMEVSVASWGIFLFAIWASFVVTATLILSVFAQEAVGDLLNPNPNLRTNARSYLKQCLVWRHVLNPFSVYLWYPLCAIFLGPVWIYRHPRAVRQFFARISQFVRYVFFAIHSDERLICLTGGAVGTIVGTSLSVPFVYAVLSGGVAAVTVGLTSYCLISVRWLKVLPKPKPSFS
jgi:hypothetical protein